MARKKRKGGRLAGKYPAFEPQRPMVFRGVDERGGTCTCPAMPGKMSQTVLLRKAPTEGRMKIDSSQAACKVLRAQANRAQEELIVLHLDTKNNVIGQTMVARGGRNEATVDPPSVFQAAILSNTQRIVLAHNHPSGDPTPSPSDVALTRRLQEAGKAVGVEVLDHVVVGERACLSMRDLGLIK